MKTNAIILLTAVCFLFGTMTARAIVTDQIDDFQDGTTQGWTGGSLSPVAPIASGGPAGVGDRYLQASTAIFHLATKNKLQWTGDYLAAGVVAIEMDLNSFGPTDLTVRILIFGPGGTYASTALTPLPTGGGWGHYVFSLAAADLVHVTGSFKVPDGTGVLADTLANVNTLLIRHDRLIPTIPGYHPPHVAATLGIDNVHAVSPLAVVQCPAYGYESRGGASYTVELDGTASMGASTYLWEQTDGIAVTTSDVNLPTLSFAAPQWSGSIELTKTEARLGFLLTINQGQATEDFDQCEVYVRIPGDANEDDTVNAFDLAKLRQLDPATDYNGDGSVNAFDLAILRQNSGRRRTEE